MITLTAEIILLATSKEPLKLLERFDIVYSKTEVGTSIENRDQAIWT